MFVHLLCMQIYCHFIFFFCIFFFLYKLKLLLQRNKKISLHFTKKISLSSFMWFEWTNCWISCEVDVISYLHFIWFWEFIDVQFIYIKTVACIWTLLLTKKKSKTQASCTCCAEFIVVWVVLCFCKRKDITSHRWLCVCVCWIYFCVNILLF